MFPFDLLDFDNDGRMDPEEELFGLVMIDEMLHDKNKNGCDDRAETEESTAEDYDIEDDQYAEDLVDEDVDDYDDNDGFDDEE